MAAVRRAEDKALRYAVHFDPLHGRSAVERIVAFQPFNIMHHLRALRGEVTLPGDKSISHRALLIAALASGESRFRGMSDAADPRSTAACLSALGVRIRGEGSSTIVTGHGLYGFHVPSSDLDCGNSGTTMRLLSGILAGQNFGTVLTGDVSLRKRPMERVAVPLRRMGAGITTVEGGRPPLSIQGRRPLKCLDFVAPLPSAQVKSAILLAGLFADGTTSVTEPIATRDHTERMLGLRTVPTERGFKTSVTGAHAVEPFDMMIPGDCSAAAFLIAAVAVVPGSEVVIKNVGVNPHRARVLDAFRRWGVGVEVVEERVVFGEPVADVIARTGAISGPLEIRPEEVPALIDEIPALASVALATGNSFLVKGAAELRAKESDRISIFVEGARSLGLVVDEYEDGFAFEGKKDVLGATVRTDGDHRIAMAFSVAGLRHPSIGVDDSACVAVSFPNFFEVLRRLGMPRP